MEKEKKDPHSSDEVVKLQKQRILLWCAIVIISFFLIVQYSVANCENTVLAAQFSFASTITSIVLSVIAIIISVVSGESLNNLLHKSRDLHDEIKDVPGKIDLSMNTLDLSTVKFEKLRDELMQIPPNIEKKIVNSMQEVNKSINSVTGGIDVLNQVVKVGFMEMKRNSVNTEETLSTKEDSPFVKDFESSFLDNSSLIGLSLLYYIAIAYEKGENVSLPKFSDALVGDDSMVEYSHGFYVASSSFNLFFIDEQVDEDMVFKITDVKIGLKEVVLSKILERSTEDDCDFLTEPIEEMFEKKCSKSIIN